jgi:hypothetical protein
MDIKKILLHIATPFAGLLSFAIACILVKLFYLLLGFISVAAPPDYKVGGTFSWIWDIIESFAGMLSAYIIIESIAPSKHEIHFIGVVVFLIILCAIEIQLLWLPMVVLTIGLIAYIYNLVKTKKDKKSIE